MLEHRGWIRRTPNPDDRRSTLIEITKDGRATADQLLPGIRTLEKSVLSALTQGEREQLLDLLAKILARAAEVAAVQPGPLSGQRIRPARLDGHLCDRLRSTIRVTARAGREYGIRKFPDPEHAQHHRHRPAYPDGYSCEEGAGRAGPALRNSGHGCWNCGKPPAAGARAVLAALAISDGWPPVPSVTPAAE
jgi:hypothetical protein